MKKWGTNKGTTSTAGKTNNSTTSTSSTGKTTTWGTKNKTDATKTGTTGTSGNGTFSASRTTTTGNGTQWTGPRSFSSQRSALNLVTSTGIPFTAVTIKEKNASGHDIENKLHHIVAFGMFSALTPEELRYNDYVMNGGINPHEWDNPKNVQTVTTTSTTTTGQLGKTSFTGGTKAISIKETTPWLAPLNLEEAVVAPIPPFVEKPFGDVEPTKIEVEAQDKDKITYLSRLSHFTARGIGKKQLLHEIATKPNSKPRSATAGLSFTQGVANKFGDGSTSPTTPTSPSSPTSPRLMSPTSPLNSPTPQILAKQPELKQQDTVNDNDVVCFVGPAPKPDMASITMWSKFGMVSFPQTSKDVAELLNNKGKPLIRITENKISIDVEDSKIINIRDAEGDFIFYLTREKFNAVSANQEYKKKVMESCRSAGLDFQCLIGGERPSLIIKGEISNIKEIKLEADSLIIEKPILL